MGSDSLSTCAKLTKFTFIFINVLYLLIGVVIIAIGSWLVHTGNTFSVFIGNDFFSGAAILIMCGIVIFLLTAFGVIAGILEKKLLLIVYVVIMVIILILEAVATILGFVYRTEIADRATTNGVEALGKYFSSNSSEFNKNINKQIDFAQENLECCGWNFTESWLTTPYYEEEGRFPDSCECKEDTDPEKCIDFEGQLIFNSTCDQLLTDKLNSNVLAIGIAGIVFTLIQILPVLLAVSLTYCIHKARDSYVTV